MTSSESIGKRAGRILAGGWGYRVAIGYLFALLEEVTPEVVLSYIREDKSLFDKISDEQWGKLQGMARTANLQKMTIGNITQEFSKQRPDLLGIIFNTVGGQQWLETQLDELKKRLL